MVVVAEPRRRRATWQCFISGGCDAPIGGLKVVAKSGWFAARPSGTESIYKIYAESFSGADHLRRILEEAQTIVRDSLATSTSPQQSAISSEGRLGNNP